MPATRGNTQRASRLLRQLLSQPGPYRRQWERQAVRLNHHDLNRAAVAQVVAQYLWDAGERSDSDEQLPRALKDRIGRALAGEVLTPETLTWFIEAFEIEEADARRLRAALGSSQASSRVITGPMRPPPDEALRHRTLLLHEFHYVGADGLPLRHRTVQLIQSLVDGLTCYPYRFDTHAVSVEVERGGTASAPYVVGEGVFCTDIRFTRPLAKGETASFEYCTSFNYRQPPAPEFRRAAYRRVENLEVRVEFHPDRLPAVVHWATWPGLDQPAQLREPVPLDGERAVHRYLEAVQGVVVGFVWEW